MDDIALARFPGGLRLPANKAAQTSQPIEVLPLPARLTLPLGQSKGVPAVALVKPGDRVLRGQMIAAPGGLVSAPVHASSSGTVIEIADHPVPHPSGLRAPCIVIETDGLDETQALERPDHDYHLEDPNLLRLVVGDAGIVGLGGAAFPTVVKLAAEAEERLQTLVLNGAECEPYISCDDMLMREHATEIIRGARAMLHILQINRCLIAIEADKQDAIEAMVTALTAIDDERFQIVQVEAIYPEGGERQLIQVLSGQEVPTRGLPIDIGYLCQNVGTAYAVARAVLFGEALTSRIVSVCGSGIANPRNLEVRIGTPLRELIEFCGGYGSDAVRLIMGGPMTGFAVPHDDLPVVKATNCVLALPATDTRKLDDVRPCIRCGECARVCPATLMPQQLYWYARDKDFERAAQFNLSDCIECGCCDEVCPSHIPLTQYFRFAKAEIAHTETERKRATLAKQRYEDRNERLTRLEVARRERITKKKQVVAATVDDQDKKKVIAEVMERVAEKNKAPGDRH